MPLPLIDSPADLRALRTAHQEAERTTPPTGPRIGIMASYTANPVVPYLGTALAEAFGRPEFHVAPYNQIVQECLDPRGGCAQAGLDVVVVAQRLEELEDGAWTRGLIDVAEAACDAASRWRATLVVVLPALPEADPLGVAGDSWSGGRTAAAVAAREAMRAALADRPNVHLVDLEAVLRSIGATKAHHPALYQFAKVPYREEVYHHLGARIAHVLRLRTGDTCHAAALDMRGLVDAGAADDIEGFGGVLRWLTAAGVRSYALGDRAAVPAWRELVASDPTAPQRLSDWYFDDRDLGTQVRDLAAEAGLAERDVALLRRREDHLIVAVRSVHGGPTEEVDLGADAAAWPMRLAAVGVFDHLPAPGAPRRAADEGTAETSGGLSLADFVAGLGTEADFRPARESDLDKINEMLVATKDFTLGVPVPPTAVAAASTDDDRALLIGSVRDRLGDLGPSVAMALARQGSDCVVEAFLVSCPAMGKGVEELAMREAAVHARAMGADRIVVGYRDTGRNHAAIDFFHSPAAADAAGTPDGALLDLVVRAEAPGTGA
jgi:predicted enzyme involved in methoxymalonyl-ACP biosynthesis